MLRNCCRENWALEALRHNAVKGVFESGNLSLRRCTFKPYYRYDGQARSKQCLIGPAIAKLSAGDLNAG